MPEPGERSRAFRLFAPILLAGLLFAAATELPWPSLLQRPGFTPAEPKRGIPASVGRREAPAPPPPPLDFAGSYSDPGVAPSRGEALAHYSMGAELLRQGDYYSAARHLAAARDGLGDFRRICELLAFTYDRLNMGPDLLAIMECLETEARESESARRLYDHLARHLDVEMEFEAAASDHFVASFPSAGPSSAAIGDVLASLEGARREIHADIGIASMRTVPVVIYEEDQFAAAMDVPHWALGIYDGKIRVSIDTYDSRPELFEVAIAHEYVHALTHEFTGVRLPSWFREGLADTLARRGTSLSADDPRWSLGPGPPLDYDELEENFTRLPFELAASSYRQSYAMVHNLVREANWGPIEDLLVELHTDEELSFDGAFAMIYGESPEAYLDRWLALGRR